MKRFPLIPSLITLFFLILMINLGFWQLRRANEKVHLLELLSDSKITSITNKKQVKDLPKYANIKIRGHFINTPQLLLDNQVNTGIQGYHVFTPFLLDGLGLYIMVNRGWLAKDAYTSDKLVINSKAVEIEGKLNTAPRVGIQLGEIVLDDNKKQQLITYYDEQKISKFLHEKLCKTLSCIVSDKVLLLNANFSEGFKRDWKPIIMPPSKHFGYAMQWFAMSLVLVLIFVYWLKKQSQPEEDFKA